MSIGLSLTGDKALDASFRALPPKLQKKIARKAIRQATKPMHADIRSDAPVDQGDYQRAIVIRSISGIVKKFGKGAVGVKVTADKKKLEELHDETGNIFNPHWMEYGTRDIGAQPHFRPGMDAHESQVTPRFHSLIAPLIVEAANEVRGKQ